MRPSDDSADVGGGSKSATSQAKRFTPTRWHNLTVTIVHIDDIRRSDTAAVFVGREHGANVSFFVSTCRRGEGADPHRHPYEETFVIQEGTAEFTVGQETFEVTAGYIVVALAGVTHSFQGASDGILRSVNIHPVAEMVAEWIE
jgi:quercetin dioxygenase-like cupin family protein